MSLTKAQKQSIEEEENYRAEIRNKLGETNEPKKKGHGCLTVIIGFIAFIIMLNVVNNVVNPVSRISETNSQSDTKSTREDELIGSVSFDGAQFVITNKDSKDWKMCSFILNSKYHYPTKTSSWLPGSKLALIKSGEELTIGSANFTLTDGSKFNPFSIKPQSFSISCDNGFSTWTW